eukprot:5931763-Prymnesium_polylepis.1
MHARCTGKYTSSCHLRAESASARTPRWRARAPSARARDPLRSRSAGSRTPSPLPSQALDAHALRLIL